MRVLLLVVAGCAGGSAEVKSTPPVDAGRPDAHVAFAVGCPEDAPWTGAVCQGRGYVACPGGMHLEKERCIGRAVPAAPPPKKSDDDEDAGASTIPECDTYLAVAERCLPKDSGVLRSLRGAHARWREAGRNAAARASLVNTCKQAAEALRKTCKS